MLTRIDSTGREVRITEIYYKDEYRNFIVKLNQTEQDEIFNFVRQSIVVGREFSVSTKFGSTVLQWETVPLILIYKACDGDQELSARILGLVVMDIAITDSCKWYCTKTSTGHSTKEPNYYWSQAA